MGVGFQNLKIMAINLKEITSVLPNDLSQPLYIKNWAKFGQTVGKTPHSHAFNT